MITCIVGPTGVGKTKVAIELAKKQNAIIINCDAMQVYKGLNIGTAKIKIDERGNIPHYLFDIVDVKTNYTVYDYQKDVRKLLDNHKSINIIIVGGTGLYLKAALFDYKFDDEKEVVDYGNYSNQELYDLASKKKQNHSIHINNRRRLERFLQKENKEVKEAKKLYEANIIGLTTNKETLYEIINNRVDKMFDDGLLKEVKHFYDKNIKSKALLNGIGYREIYQYFDKKISLAEAKELIKKKSRNYAKRQYTWFNNQMDVTWFNIDFENLSKTIDEINQLLNS